VSSPKERLQEAAHKLAGSAENIEDLLCPRPTISDPLGVREPHEIAGVPSDNLPEVIRAGIKEVRKYADQIEEIVK
jgi:hypothetical protein